jgi:hypothetical protein
MTVVLEVFDQVMGKISKKLIVDTRLMVVAGYTMI